MALQFLISIQDSPRIPFSRLFSTVPLATIRSVYPQRIQNWSCCELEGNGWRCLEVEEPYVESQICFTKKALYRQ